MVYAATYVEDNMGSLPVTKIKEKTCFRWSAFMIDYISAYKSRMASVRLDLESNKPRWILAER